MEKGFNWEIFFTLLQDELIVPIIGPELILVKTDNNTQLPIYEYITLKLAERLNLDPKGSNLYSFISNHQNSTFINSMIRPVFNDISIEDINLEPLIKLAQIDEFKVFLSLSFDNFLEEALTKIRCSEDDSIEIINHSPTPTAVRPIINKNHKALIFNLLGNIKLQSGCARTDEELIEYLFAIVSGATIGQKLYSEIDGKGHLYLGCNLPDYTNLIFIRTISNESLSKGENIKFLVENNYTNTASLDVLRKNRAEIYQPEFTNGNNVVSFINEMYERWQKRKSTSVAKRYEGGVFFSYHPSDKYIVEPFIQILSDNGIEIWHEESDSLSDHNARKKIRNQIKSCILFITFVSNSSLTDNYKKTEWQFAKSRRSFFEDEGATSFIIPYLIGDITDSDARIPEFLKSIPMQNVLGCDVLKDVIPQLQLL